MAYLSDIDLATLHKKRLDEKNHYKLSWYNRRFYDDEMSHEPRTTHKSEEHKVKSKVNVSDRSTKPKASVLQATLVKQTRAANDVNNNTAHDAVVNKTSACAAVSNRNRSPDFYDEGYFSSPTLSRRRSGTWP